MTKPIIDNPILNNYVNTSYYWHCVMAYAKAEKIPVNQSRKEIEEIMVQSLNNLEGYENETMNMYRKLWNGRINTCLACTRKFIVPFHEFDTRKFSTFCHDCDSGLPDDITKGSDEIMEKSYKITQFIFFILGILIFSLILLGL